MFSMEALLFSQILTCRGLRSNRLREGHGARPLRFARPIAPAGDLPVVGQWL